MAKIGSKLVFEEANEELESLVGISMNAKQIERVCHYYGDTTYAMIDGSMLFAREEKWKEIKLGRVFSSSSMIRLSKDRGCITDTLYVSHFGKSNEFWEKLSKELPHNNLVFINDGAKWIWNYIEDHYPDSTQILDYYHCKGHIYDFAKYYYNNDLLAEKFVSTIINMLFAQQVDKALEQIGLMECQSKTKLKEKEKLLG